MTQLWGVEPKAQEDPSISAQWRQAHGAARPAALGTERTGQEWLRKKKGSFRLAHSVDFFRHGLREEMHTTAIRDASTPVKGASRSARLPILPTLTHRPSPRLLLVPRRVTDPTRTP